MKRYVVAVLVVAACFCLASRTNADEFFEHSYAVIVGIDSYSSPFPKLSYAVKDAQAMAQFLREQGYRVFPLYDQQATRQAIITTLQNKVAPVLTNRDRVLFFFAGHGWTETLGGKDRGYIVPYDGGSQSASYISMDDLATQSDYMGVARHQLFIMDSCYGGILASTRASIVDPSVPDYLHQVTTRVAKQVLTAGGRDQQVMDGGPQGHSYFVDYFLEAVRDGKADLNEDGYVTFSELSAYLTPRASNNLQTPATGVLPGHGAGEYLFKVPSATPRAVANQGAMPVGDARRGGQLVSTEANYSRQTQQNFGALRGVSLSPATFPRAGEIEKIDLKLVGTLDEPDSTLNITSVAFSSNEGQLLVSTAEVDNGPGANRFGGNGSVRLWDVATGQLTRSLQNSGGDRPRDQFEQAAYSPDGKLVAALSLGDGKGYTDTKSFLKLWDIAGTPLNILGNLFLPETVAFSPDSSLLAIDGCKDKGKDSSIGNVCIYAVSDGKLIRLLPHPGVIASIAFNRDGSLLAVGDRDWHPSVRIWDTRTWARVQDLQPRLPSDGEAVSFSPDGNSLATGHARGGVYLWDVRTWTRLRTMRFADTEEGRSRSIVFGPYGKFLTFVSGNRLQFWNPANGKLLGDFDVNPLALALQRGGQLLATVSQSAKSIQLWQIQMTTTQ